MRRGQGQLEEAPPATMGAPFRLLARFWRSASPIAASAHRSVASLVSAWSGRVSGTSTKTPSDLGAASLPRGFRRFRRRSRVARRSFAFARGDGVRDAARAPRSMLAVRRGRFMSVAADAPARRGERARRGTEALRRRDARASSSFSQSLGGVFRDASLDLRGGHRAQQRRSSGSASSTSPGAPFASSASASGSVASTSFGCLRATDRQNSSAAVSEAAAANAASRELPRHARLDALADARHARARRTHSGTSCMSFVKSTSACSNSRTSWTPRRTRTTGRAIRAGPSRAAPETLARRARARSDTTNTSPLWRRGPAGTAVRVSAPRALRCVRTPPPRRARAPPRVGRLARFQRALARFQTRTSLRRGDALALRALALARATAPRVVSMSAAASANACACILLSACTFINVKSTAFGVFATNTSRVFSAVSKSPSSACTCASLVATLASAGSRAYKATKCSSARCGSRISKYSSACAQRLESPRPSPNAYAFGSFFSASP